MPQSTEKKTRPGPESRRTPMIEAARKSFVANGFDGTSLDDIIAEAGGSRRNIYDMFGGKDGLLRAVIGQILSEIVDAGNLPEASGTSPRDWLMAVGTSFVRQMLSAEVIALFRQFVAQGGAEQEYAERLWKAGPERLQGAIADWLRYQNRLGQLDVPNPEVAARLLPEMFRGSLQIEVLVGRKTSVTESEIEAQVSDAVDFFLRSAAR